MADEPGSDAQKKKEEMERRKAEVRKRLEESGKAGKKAKKGFLTPERKKKLRKLLMMKAAEDLKNQQLQKEQERQKVLADRTIPCPDLESVSDQGKLISIYEELFEVVKRLEGEKFDLNQVVLAKEAEINSLSIAVNDLRGKYVKPVLKKVSKYDNKFKASVVKEGGEKKADFRNQLKTVKKEVNLDDLIKKKDEKPDWSKKDDKKKEDDGEKSVAEPAPPAEEKTEEPAEAEPEEEEDGEGEEEEEE